MRCLSCAEVRDLLHPFLDGELEVDRNVVMLKHLELCPPCRTRSEAEQELRGMVVRACCEPLSAERGRALIAAACMDEGDAEPVVVPAGWRWRRWAAAAVVLVALGAGAYAMHVPCLMSDCRTRRFLAVAREKTLLEPPLSMDALCAQLGAEICPPNPIGLTLVGGNALQARDGRQVPLLRYSCDCDGKEVVVAPMPVDVHAHGWDLRRLDDGREYLVVEVDGTRLVGWKAPDGRLWCVIGCGALPQERLYVVASAIRDGAG
jgi:hypothetical protein